MRVPTLLLLCVILTVGLYDASNAASISSREEGSVTANNGKDVISVVTSIFNCGLLPANKLPSATEVATDPAGSMRTVLCFIVHRVADVSQGMASRLIPAVVETLKKLNETGVIPPPISTYINTLLMIYEMSNSLMNGK